MNLTEPGAGSDLAAVQTKAVRQSDGSYRVTGQKIFITYGEHDMANNIVHLVLARTPDAPKGVKGISLFVVPKFLVGADGSVGARNDVRCASIEHKLGIHGSPTAVMLFGENEGAVGYLVGEENRGLEYMFIMMNDARFSVGLQGLSISSRAFQHAAAYALERVQGRAVGEDGSQGKTIVRHPDVRRMLLSMKSRIDAMRAMAIYVAVQRDRAHSYILPEPDRNAAQARLELLIPVLKGWFTESAQRITYDGVQVFGGMGFVEETGAAQYYRDARILTIYEGTTAIQANDLVGRKTVRDGGQAALALLNQIEREAESAAASDDAVLKLAGSRLEEACQSLRAVVQWVLETNGKQPRQVYAGSVPYLHAWGIVVGGWMHLLRLNGARAADLDAQTRAAVMQSARYFAESELVAVPGLAASIVSGSNGLLEFPDDRWVA
jgi:alkylation response protein AidB-like acyl-CoA dehydrogenase